MAREPGGRRRLSRWARIARLPGIGNGKALRRLALLGCVSLGSTAWAQDDAPPVRWPVLARTAPDAAGFAPRGWAVEASRTGDVDGDGIADLVAILHQRSPRNVLHEGQMRADGLDTNPRLLVVAIGRRGGPFRLLFANRTLIPRWTEWNLDDPLGVVDGFVVQRGAFSVPLHLFANAGGWGASDRDLTFRVIGGRCVLIGYDEQYLQRNTGVTTTTSINYLTGVKQVDIDSIDGNTPARTRRTRLSKRPLPTIEEVGDGREFEPK